MNEDVDLDYDPKSIVGPLDENEIHSFESWLHASGQGKIHFERAYIEHLRKHHGGVPGKRYFQSVRGTKHVVTRFLNFLGSSSNNPLKQYSVPCIWSAIDDRLSPNLMPFAELFAGDMLCFDFENGGRPEIVLWFHELSQPNKPLTELVSTSFEEFVKTLRDKAF